jgi:arylsulfatase A-like enzyme
LRKELTRGLVVSIWATLVLILHDIARVPASSVPEHAGWVYLGELCLLGLAAYGPLFVVVILGVAVARGARAGGSAGTTGPSETGKSLGTYAGLGIAGMVTVSALAVMSERRGAPGWMTAAWLLDVQLVLLGACAAGWGTAALVRAVNRRSRGRLALAVIGLLPVAPALVGLLPAANAAGVAAPGGKAEAASTERPDIFLIVADTLRADALSSYSGEGLPTPVLDRLAASGARFANATAQASWTNPSTATILSGQMPSDHGMIGHEGEIRSEVRMIAELLAASGYQTVGMVANPLVSRAYGFHRGFRHWDEEPDPRALARHGWSFAARLARASGWFNPRGGTPDAREMMDKALPFLERESGKPLFLYLHLMDPHDPYEAPAGLEQQADPDYSGPLSFRESSLYQIMRGEVSVNLEDLRHAHALYGAEVAYMDRQLGRLLDAIQPRVDAGQALVLFTSDHGEEFMEHGFLGHEHTLYQELVHVPLLVAQGGAFPEGMVVDENVSHLDVVPTILGAAGVPPMPELPGRNLLHLARGTAAVAETAPPVISEENYTGYRTSSHKFRSARSGDWKVILRSPNVFGIGPWRREVFDLAGDPGERASLEEAPPVAAILEAELRERIERERGSKETSRPLDPETERRLRALGYAQ